MSTRLIRRPARPLRLLVVTAAVVVVLAASVAPAGAGGISAKTAPRLKDPSATGRELSVEFLTILQQGDTVALARFLDPSFQLQRADGTGVDREQYVANPAVVGQFVLGDAVVGVQHRDVLTVRWAVKADVAVDGKPYSDAEAPRLSTYRWDKKRWRLTSHANFNRPA
jgi:hypothetical protein